MRVLQALALAGVFAACSPAPGGGGGGPTPTTWLIPAGQHESTGSRVELTTTDELTLRVRFDATAAYTTIDPLNQLDVNKLRGLSDCSAGHQDYSARVGWRWTGSAVELSAYTYLAGVRSTVVLGLVPPGTWHDLSLALAGSSYRFVLDGVATTVPRGCSSAGALKYQLWPYFGGTEVAPHDITIEILE